MSLSVEEELLTKVPFFSQMKAEELREVFARLKRRIYRNGETVFHKDDAGSTMYIIKEGNVKISVPSDAGSEIILSILSKGDFFGELSLFDEKPRSATVTSSGTTEVYVFHRSDFIDLVSKHPRVSLSIISALSTRIRSTDAMVTDVVFLDIPARLAKKLLELARNHEKRLTDGSVEIDIRLTQQELASMLGTTRESVNRQLISFQERGILLLDRQRITILKPKELEDRIY